MDDIAATIKTKFELSGEKEYKQALSEINGGLKVLTSEMELTAAQFDNTADSMEGLSKKNDVLDRMISTQKDKVKVLEEALKNAGQEYGEADKRTQQWQTSLNKAKAELENMERELDSSNKELDDFNKNMVGLGDAIEDVTGLFGVQLPNSFKNFLNEMKEVDEAAFLTSVKFVGIATAAIGLEKSLANMTKEEAAAADEILTLSTTTGLATDTIQEMQYASELLDVDFNTVKDSMTKLINNMELARDGSKSMTPAFAALGVEVSRSDGTLRDAEETFYDVIAALGEIENETERDALAMDVFGKSAQDLNPLIEQGRDRLQELADEAHEVGYVMDGEMLDSLGAVDDATQRLDKAWESAKKRLAAEFAPSLTEFTEGAGDAITDLADNFADSGLVDLFGSVLELAGSLLPLLNVLSPAFEILGTVVQPVAWALGELADMLQAVFGWVGKLADKAGNWLGGMFAQYDLDTIIPGNAGGTDFWRGGLTWVGEQGPELVNLPRGSQIIPAQESRQMMGGGTVYNITIDAKNVREFNDIVRIAQTAQFRERMGVS